jgi:hypothetical protein
MTNTQVDISVPMSAGKPTSPTLLDQNADPPSPDREAYDYASWTAITAPEQPIWPRVVLAFWPGL